MKNFANHDLCETHSKSDFKSEAAGISIVEDTQGLIRI